MLIGAGDLPHSFGALPLNAQPGTPPQSLFTRDALTGDWFGARSALEERGVQLDATLTIDGARTLTGGIDRDWGVHHLFEAGLTLDLERLADLDGAAVFAGFYTNDGDRLSDELTGDLQIFSNIDEAHRAQLSELWYEQRWLDGRWRLKIGKVDANEEFAAVESAGFFTQSSMGFSPTIFVLPSYPDPAMSVNVFTSLTENVEFGVGVYDGAAARGIPTGKRGPSSFFEGFDDLFLIGEVGVQWGVEDDPHRLAGRLTLGGWHHTGRFDRFDGRRESGTGGFYATIDQAVWRSDPLDDAAPGIHVFAQYGMADRDVSEFAHHAGGGVTWRGLIPGRADDVLGLGLSWVRFSNQPAAGFSARGELDVELFYRIQVTPWLALQPDLHVILNPGGVDRDDAVVALLRAEIVF